MELFFATLFIIISLLLIVVVLLQKGRGGGLGSVFSGAGSAAFGTRTGDVFTWVTIVLTALFLLLAIGTTLIYRPASSAIEAPAQQAPPAEAPLATSTAPATGETAPAAPAPADLAPQTAPAQ